MADGGPGKPPIPVCDMCGTQHYPGIPCPIGRPAGDEDEGDK